jgi:hypothetical protein
MSARLTGLRASRHSARRPPAGTSFPRACRQRLHGQAGQVQGRSPGLLRNVQRYGPRPATQRPRAVEGVRVPGSGTKCRCGLRLATRRRDAIAESERRRSRTHRAVGYTTAPVLKVCGRRSARPLRSVKRRSLLLVHVRSAQMGRSLYARWDASSWPHGLDGEPNS